MYIYLTCVGHGGIFVEGHQWWIQQDDVGVFGDHAMVRRLNPRLVFVHCGGRKCDVSVKNVFHGGNYNSFWFRLLVLFSRQHLSTDTLALTQPYRQIEATMHPRTHDSVLGKAPPASFCARHFLFANLPCLSSPHFLPSSISCRFQSTVPCLINDHHCAAGRPPPPKPSTNKVHEPRAWFCPMIQFKSREQSYA